MKVSIKYVQGTTDDERERVQELVDKLIVQADKYNTKMIGKIFWITDAISARKIESVKAFKVI